MKFRNLLLFKKKKILIFAHDFRTQILNPARYETCSNAWVDNTDKGM